MIHTGTKLEVDQFFFTQETKETLKHLLKILALSGTLHQLLKPSSFLLNIDIMENLYLLVIDIIKLVLNYHHTRVEPVGRVAKMN